jgi:protein ImuA
MYESNTVIGALRARIARLEGARVSESAATVALGHHEIDARLDGGLARGRLHEVFASEEEDAGAGAGFAAMLAHLVGCVADRTGAVVWLRQEEADAKAPLHGPGLAELGLDPAGLVLGLLPDALSVLRVAAEVVRCADVGAVVIELWRAPRALDLTASRRLAVAAEGSGVTALLLRILAEPSASAAHTRWQVRSAPAVPLAANAPGFPTLDVELSRQRGGKAGGRWCVEWDRDQAIFRAAGSQAALSGAVVSVPAGGPAGTAWRPG